MPCFVVSSRIFGKDKEKLQIQTDDAQGTIGSGPLVLRQLRRRAMAEGGWHGLGVLALFALLQFTLPSGVAVQWLIQSLAVALFVHFRLWRNLRQNHPPGNESLSTSLGAANRITLVRGLLLSFIAGFLFIPDFRWSSMPEWVVWAPGVLYLLAACLDAADGRIARRADRVSALGQKLDIEMDALGLLAASGLAIWLGRLPLVYLLAGMAYYCFRFGIWYRHWRGKPVHKVAPRPFARTIAGIQMGFVGVALLPVFPDKMLHVAGFYFMLPLLSGFFWDWLVVSGRSKVRVACRIAKRFRESAVFFPAVLRSSLLLCAFPIARELFYMGPTGFAPVWCVLLSMMVLGWLGRTAGLLASVLLAGSASETGFPPPVLLIGYSCSIFIFVFGTGGGSLWKPEDKLLHRPFELAGH